jgi:hypothetical protein
MTSRRTPMIDHKPAYKLECKDCNWWINKYFDQILPERCARGHQDLKKHSLQIGEGYNHDRQLVMKIQAS